MKVGSLFTGIGGFDIGFERAGATIEWQCEIDKHASSVLARHWPDVPNHGDVTMIGAPVGKVDLICGGFPCQDVSVAGRRAGLAGERSGLWYEFHRIARELRPEWVVIENVPGLLSSHGGADFAVILQGLAELGYGAAWRVLDAQYFGLAQRRKRVFIVGHLGDGRAAEVLFESEGVSWDPPARRAQEQDVAACLVGGSVGGSSHGEPSGSDKRLVVANAITASAGHHGHSSPRGDGSDNLDEEELSPALRTGGGGSSVSQIVFDPTQVTSAPDVAYALAARNAKGVSLLESQDTFVTSPGAVRRLTPTECERLQGFPDGHTAGQADSHRYRQLGNAIAVPVAEWIARRIMTVHDKT